VGHYLLRTSKPRVRAVHLSDDFRYFTPRPGKPSCTQLGVIEILGDLYFGAVSHIEDCVQENLTQNPTQRFLLLRMYTVENCDISGIRALESIVHAYRDRGGDVFFVHVQRRVRDLMRASGFYQYLGADHFLDPDGAISYLFHKVVDPAICVYECPVRAFEQCQNLPKHLQAADLEWETDISLDVPLIGPQALWRVLRGGERPTVIDVREPREFRRGHIPEARLIPLPKLLGQIDQVPRDHAVVLVCHGGRRSTRATALLRERGYENVQVLEGGMLAWKREHLLEAIE
jgi:SulP family sulfate permease